MPGTVRYELAHTHCTAMDAIVTAMRSFYNVEMSQSVGSFVPNRNRQSRMVRPSVLSCCYHQQYGSQRKQQLAAALHRRSTKLYSPPPPRSGTARNSAIQYSPSEKRGHLNASTRPLSLHASVHTARPKRDNRCQVRYCNLAGNKVVQRIWKSFSTRAT